MKYPLVITFHKFLLMLDGTVGASYFDRFHLKSELSEDKSLMSVALQAFIREKEVNYDRFCTLYWPHFDNQLTKNLDPSRVFTEVISFIKGGLKAGDFHDGKLSREAYISLSEYRISTISAETRDRIFGIFQDYEKMKIERGEYDLADLVNDLHFRLKNQHLDGDKVDFVYVDEVQDLTMRQIALFKYICRNVDEGFVFSGDTAQTIARGIDFRFEDIRNLFYSEFVMASKGGEAAGRNDKGHLSSVFQLLQNFRTHAGVLRLAQSVIDLLCHYFPQSVDFLKPETSLIYGEAPVLLNPGADENAILTIFGNSGSVGGNIIGFGADQVILVRDESAKKEISGFIGSQALILTIVECKGLEFQDVLLYNFFGSSPLKNQWRVVYEFMKERGLQDMTFTSFCEARHSILCSELKQLYVAITRTRQRLWICESKEEFSKPMFDYWRRLCLVETREIDDSLAQAMQTSSSPEEWRSRGVKLFWEKNYEMAIMCFEKAGEKNWEKRAKAAGFRAAAERIRDSNPKEASTYLREAAEIFDSIGRFESAAECFYDLREYKRAGNIYLEKCGMLLKSAECFTLAGCYDQAAEVYAKGSYFSECLSVCSKGKHFDLGLNYVEYWKQHALQGSTMGERANEIVKIEEEFLEKCAFNYYELNDRVSMMKFVKAFSSMDMKRRFLKSLECVDELLLLEEELGNFTEAAELARQEGDILREADIVGKAGDFDKASSLVLLYVLSNSLWLQVSKGWPPKPFTQKEQLLQRIRSFTSQGSNSGALCTVVKVLSYVPNDWSGLKHLFIASQQCESLSGEFLCCRKILDFHFENNVVNYVWDDKLSASIQSSEDLLSCSQVSVHTLLQFWNLWKKTIFDLLESLEGLHIGEHGECNSFCSFCLDYFGARQQLKDGNVTYVLLHPTAEWVKTIHQSFIRRINKLVCVDARHFVSAARHYWHTELLVVGLKVLETLESLYKSAISMSLFRQSMCILSIYEVAKFLSESKDLESKSFERRIRNFLRLTYNYFEKVFPLDPRQSLVENMISLRRTELSCELLQEFIHQDINTRGALSYGQVGRVAIIWLASGKPSNDLYKQIVGRIPTKQWKSFMEVLVSVRGTECLEESLSGHGIGGGQTLESHEVLPSYDHDCSQKSSNDPIEALEFTFVHEFLEALQDTYNANWIGLNDYISPVCFLYLVERFLMLVSQFRGSFFTTKSSLVEWIAIPTSRLAVNRLTMEKFYDSILVMVQELIFNKVSTIEWISRSKLNVWEYYKLLVLRLVVILCLLCVNSGKYYDVLIHVLSIHDVRNQLPKDFYGVLRPGLKRKYIQISEIGEAFRIATDPLFLVNLGDNVTKEYSNVVSLQLGNNCTREYIMELLFPSAQHSTSLEDANTPCNTDTPICGDQLKTLTVPFSEVHPPSEQNLQMNWPVFQEISDLLKLIGNENDGTSADISTVSGKVKVLQSSIEFLTVAITLPAVRKPCGGAGDDIIQEVHSMLEELKQLHSLLVTRNSEVESAERLSKSLMLRKAKLEVFLNQCIAPTGDSDSVTPEKHCEEKGDSVCGKVEKIELFSTTTDSESVTPAEHCEGKGDAAFGEVEDMQLPSATTKSESSNQGGQSKQEKGKGKSKKPKKVKNKKKK